MDAKRSPAIWLAAEVTAQLRGADETHLPVLARLALAITDCSKGDASLLQRLLRDLRDTATAMDLTWSSQGMLGAVTGRKLAERRQLATASRAFLRQVEALRTESDAFAGYSARFEEACLAALPEYSQGLARLERVLAEAGPSLRSVYEDLGHKREQAGSQHVHEALQRLRVQADAASERLARQVETGRHARRLPLVAEDIRRCHAELEEQLEGIVTSRAARVLQHVADALTAQGEAAVHSLAQAERLRVEVLAGVDSLLDCLDRLLERQAALVEAFSALARRLAEVERGPSGAADLQSHGMA